METIKAWAVRDLRPKEGCDGFFDVKDKEFGVSANSIFESKEKAQKFVDELDSDEKGDARIIPCEIIFKIKVVNKTKK